MLAAEFRCVTLCWWALLEREDLEGGDGIRRRWVAMLK
jgi:hypothetical protein